MKLVYFLIVIVQISDGCLLQCDNVTISQNSFLSTTSKPDYHKKTTAKLEIKKSKRYFCPVDEDSDLLINGTKRLKRYVLQGNKWEKLNLRWAVVKPSKKQSVNLIAESELESAFMLWSQVSKLTFTKVNPTSSGIDIVVKFEEWDHGDRYAFDGTGNTLAHAFYPGENIGGDVHFDDSEPFMDHDEAQGNHDGVSLFITAAHELGHSLGLHHSNEEKALMAPYYQSFAKDFKLPLDDQRGIQSLYGTKDQKPAFRPRLTTRKPPPTARTTRYTTPRARTTRYPTPTRKRTSYFPNQPGTTPQTTKRTTSITTSRYDPLPRITPSSPRNPCLTKNLKPKEDDYCSREFDAVAHLGSEIFFFKKKNVRRVDIRSQSVYKYPITSMFPELLNLKVESVDAAFSLIDGQGLVLFSGDRIITILHKNPQVMSLRDIGVNATSIDAAWRWGHNGHVYLLSGNLYWRLGADRKAQDDYPRDSSVWQGLPNRVSAAFTFKGVTYFFSGGVFWPFDNLEMQIKQPALDSVSYWLACPSPIVAEHIPC